VGSYLAHAPKIHPKTHENHRAFFCISSPIFLESFISLIVFVSAKVVLVNYICPCLIYFPKWQQMVLVLIALMIATTLGVCFSLSLALPEFPFLKFHQLFIPEANLDGLVQSELVYGVINLIYEYLKQIF